MTQIEGHSSQHIKGIRCGFALLPNKKETYELLFFKLKERIQPTNLEHIMTDFDHSLFRLASGVLDLSLMRAPSSRK